MADEITEDDFNRYRITKSEITVSLPALQEVFQTLWKNKFPNHPWTNDTASVEKFERNVRKACQNRAISRKNQQQNMQKITNILGSLQKDESWYKCEWDISTLSKVLVDCRLFKLEEISVELSDNIKGLMDIRNKMAHRTTFGVDAQEFENTMISLKKHMEGLQCVISVHKHLQKIEELESQEKPTSRNQFKEMSHEIEIMKGTLKWCQEKEQRLLDREVFQKEKQELERDNSDLRAKLKISNNTVKRQKIFVFISFLLCFLILGVILFTSGSLLSSKTEKEEYASYLLPEQKITIHEKNLTNEVVYTLLREKQLFENIIKQLKISCDWKKPDHLLKCCLQELSGFYQNSTLEKVLLMKSATYFEEKWLQEKISLENLKKQYKILNLLLARSLQRQRKRELQYRKTITFLLMELEISKTLIRCMNFSAYSGITRWFFFNVTNIIFPILVIFILQKRAAKQFSDRLKITLKVIYARKRVMDSITQMPRINGISKTRNMNTCSSDLDLDKSHPP